MTFFNLQSSLPEFTSLKIGLDTYFGEQRHRNVRFVDFSGMSLSFHGKIKRQFYDEAMERPNKAGLSMLCEALSSLNVHCKLNTREEVTELSRRVASVL